MANQPRSTSILTGAQSATGRTTGRISAQFSTELHPLPPIHLDASDLDVSGLQRQMLDQYEAVRRATLSSRQNPWSAPSISRNITTTASPASPQFVMVPHALGRSYTGVHVCRAQGTPFVGHEVPAGSVGFVQVTNGGTGYTTPPVVTVSGGGGTGVSGQAVIQNGSVIGVTLSNAGQNHTGTPTVSLTGGGGNGAVAAAQMPPSFDPTTHSLHVVYSSGTYDFIHSGD